MVFLGGAVVCFCGGELISKRAEGDGVAMYSDLYPIQVAFRAEGYSLVGGAVFSVTSLGAVA